MKKKKKHKNTEKLTSDGIARLIAETIPGVASCYKGRVRIRGTWKQDEIGIQVNIEKACLELYVQEHHQPIAKRHLPSGQQGTLKIIGALHLHDPRSLTQTGLIKFIADSLDQVIKEKISVLQKEIATREQKHELLKRLATQKSYTGKYIRYAISTMS